MCDPRCCPWFVLDRVYKLRFKHQHIKMDDFAMHEFNTRAPAAEAESTKISQHACSDDANGSRKK